MSNQYFALIFRSRCPERPEFHNLLTCYIFEDGKLKMPLYHSSANGISNLMLEFIKQNREISSISRLKEHQDWEIPNYANMPIEEKEFLEITSQYEKKLEY